ncbi:NAD-dependent succinate-semialdehyde dehydrogenase [Chelativorans sp. SCAU2101]|uniref:NAD-dependent succinate-semialdehyde dehydrogenase n=1 Tax=Chelativorans petroleitrophicus TaxID=2975484 RepID=A0A9X2XAZ7_9HYPH|nr:NAD-dependent succinate-semialdehyde dehydrogenase [Chelativorans petroleitrophicus]MCT8990752.1 NAD-dependent succinate-semialdehyde dehydrogenase [Chelativorans petroleitrophicus]
MTSAYPELGLFIDNELRPGRGSGDRRVVNPATGDELARLPIASAEDLNEALTSSERAFAAWRRVSALERSNILRKAAGIIRSRVDEFARTLTLEQGKVLAEARIEMMAAADIIDWFAEEGRRAYGRVIPSRQPDIRFSTLLVPVGPVAAFSPWNFPAVIPARKVAASLAAGCTCIIKPAEETPATMLGIAQAFAEAGLPDGVLNVVTGEPAEISTHLIASPIIRKVSFTGSTAVGREIGRLAAGGIKRVTLELGGHAPVLVLEDADIEKAVSISAAFKFRNAGQVCIAPTRFYVHERVYDDFVNGLTTRAAALKVADGLAEGTQMGPLANSRRVKAMERLISDAVTAGARLTTGGESGANRGYFWQPTVLADVPETARIMNEEPFGPVAVVRRVSSVDEAIAAANRLPYGLAAYAFTRSTSNSIRLGQEIEAGMLGINNMMINLAETPFGGVKESGYGSEGGSEGLHAYLDVKLISES